MRRDDLSGKIMMMLVGSFVGAAVALLLAPQTVNIPERLGESRKKGRKSRSKIRITNRKRP